MKKNLLLLGGLGFIGQNLIEELKHEYNLIVFGHQPSHRSHDYLYCSGDFTKLEELEPVFQNYKIDLAIHLISSTIPSSDDIVFDINSNITSTIHLLELLKKYFVSKILFCSSGGTVYGLMNEKNQIDENHPTYPISAHGINKLAIEKYIYLYHYRYDLEYLIVRLSNPYGEKHASAEQGLINIALKKVINNDPVIIWGDGAIIRDYIYIKDCAKIIHDLLRKNIFNQIINVGSGQGYSINQILSLIRDRVGDFAIIYKSPRTFDVPKIVLDIHKLKSFIPVQLTPINIGIYKTYQWLKSIPE